MDVINATLLITTLFFNDTVSPLPGISLSTNSDPTAATPRNAFITSSSTIADMITTESSTTVTSDATTLVDVITTSDTSTGGNKTSDKFLLTIEMINAKKVKTFIPAIVYTSLLMIVGIPGNAMALYVYFSKWKRSSTRTFILTLAMVDLVNCCSSLPFEIVMMSLPLRFDSGIVCKIFRFSTYLCNTSAALILVAIAVDRYQRICNPLEDHMSSKTAKISIGVIMLISVITLAPSLILYGTFTVPIPISSTTILFGKMCSIENYFLQSHPAYPLAYFIFHMAATFIIFIILTILYSFIGIQVCRRNRLRAMSRSVRSLSDFSVEDEDDKLYIGSNANTNKKSSETEELNKNTNKNGRHKTNGNVPPAPGAVRMVFMSAANMFKKRSQSVAERRAIRIGKTTVMLIVVTVVYVISFVPFIALSIHRLVDRAAYSNLDPSAESAYNLFFRLYLLNCAANPLIYSFCNELFRKECKAVIKRIFGRK